MKKMKYAYFDFSIMTDLVSLFLKQKAVCTLHTIKEGVYSQWLELWNVDSGHPLSKNLCIVPLKGHFCSQIDFFLILDPISRHNSKIPLVFRIPDFDLKPAQILENVPSPIPVGDLAITGWQFGQYR